MERLSSEVQNYDPTLSLYGGVDGLDAYRMIIKQAPRYLKESGRLILEIGYDQKTAVAQLLTDGLFKDVKCHSDLSGFDRIMTAQVKLM